jgi:serine/threonine protein kinase
MDAPSPVHPTEQTLSSFGLGKLDDGPAEAVNKHLEQCPDCRKRVAELSADSFLERVRDARKPSDKSTSGEPQAGGTQNYKGSLTPPAADALPPGLADHPDYEIKKELGRGGMGVVYLAHNKLMGRDEVLKVMGRHIMERPGVLDRFLREIRAVARLRHPNIVTAYSAVRVGESIVFAMEFVDGLDLARMVKAKGPLPVSHACNFVYQSALGMLSRKGSKATVKVLDFGLAKATCEEQVDGALTSQGQALGTPDFIAPEQIQDAPNVDIRADIYSLGATLYYLLTGQPPFKAKSLYDVYQAHISRDADRLNLVRPEVPAELAALVAKMMAKDPARRFQTPGAVAQALAPFFKTGSAAFKSPKADVSQAGLTSAARPTAGEVSTPTEPATEAGKVALQAEKTAKPPATETRWESLIEFREEKKPADAVAAPVVVPTRRPPWVWPAVAVGVVVLGLLVAWLGGTFRVKTPDGVIVLENLPKDAEILVDGGKITVTWPGDDKPVEIRAVPGQRKVEVKKDGFKTFGEVVTVKTGESEEVTVRLEPLDVEPDPDQAPGPSPAAGTDDAPTAPTDGRSYRLVNVQSGKALAVGSRGKGLAVVQADVADDPSQFWTLRLIKDTTRYKMVNLRYNVCLNVSNAMSNRGSLVPYTEGPGNFNEVWDFHWRGNAFRISSPFWFPTPFPLVAGSGIAVKAGSQAGEDVVLLPPTARDNELWKLIEKPTTAGWTPLFNGKDLSGWEAVDGRGYDGSQFWSVRDGILHGEGGASYLFTTRRDYGDVKLRAEMKVNTGGNSGVYVRASKEFPYPGGYEANVQSTGKGPKTGSLYKPPEPPVVVDPSPVPPDVWCTIEIEAIRNRVRVFVDGKLHVDWTDMLDGKPPGHVALQVLNANTHVQCRKVEVMDLSSKASGPGGQVSTATGSPAAAGWTPLFNGKDLTGWKRDPSQPGNWRVENGVLIGSGPQTSHLYTERNDFRDLHLRLEARYNDGGNAAVLFRSGFGPVDPKGDPKRPRGYEVPINSTHGAKGTTGGFVSHRR